MPFNLLLDLREHLHVAHHVPGRIRIKFGTGLLKDPRAKDLINAAERADMPAAIRDARINKMARSVVIAYDPDAIAPNTLAEALSTKDAERFEILVEELRDTLLPEQ